MKVRKNPIIQNACFLNECKSSPEDWVIDALTTKTIFESGGKWYVQTLEGIMTGNPKDVLMQGIKGELYICERDIFEKTYTNIDSEGDPSKNHPIPTPRLMHMIGVAEYMYKNAHKYNLPKDEMYVLGLLHDIGYIYGKENHEESGRMLLYRLGLTSAKGFFEYGSALAHHDEIPKENVADITKRVQTLLLEADMTVDMNGDVVGFDHRLKDIGMRHGFNSKPYKKSELVVNWLKERKESQSE